MIQHKLTFYANYLLKIQGFFKIIFFLLKPINKGFILNFIEKQ
ncbi:Uncharacterised protein [Sphingobacterium mizutaii]|uniref:Uncharacterized protein n=1 Tax=Sphingobacterium mizutaii TaxID=1010 RepID=A0AAJ4XBL7_9SPHI|nr:hypothetical protein SAMN05192578_101885 [Sphingobacterium mizutaii]SNV50270.1 Uncharacterised protein [Sphingobacterium mizutaii]